MPQFHIPPHPTKADSIDDLVSADVAEMLDQLDVDEHEPVHAWFGLTYSNYLVEPRALLQSMPVDWQRRFVRCLRELEHVVTAAGVEVAEGYTVQPRTDDGCFVSEPVPHYNRGRTQLDLTPREPAHV